MTKSGSYSSRDKIGTEAHPRHSEQHLTAPTPRFPVIGLQRAAGHKAVNELLRGKPHGEAERVAPTPDAPTDNGDSERLDRSTRALMESRFGYDFSSVRIKTDGEAATLARMLGARAYTVGRDVFFGRGQYVPHTSEGQRLLAHELAHVIQQSRGGAIPPVDSGAEHEHSAERAAAEVVSGHAPVQVTGSTDVGVARKVDPEIEKALEPLKEALSTNAPSKPAKMKALTPDELIDDHVFGPRVESQGQPI